MIWTEEIPKCTWQKNYSDPWLLGYRDGVKTDWRFHISDIEKGIIEVINSRTQSRVKVSRDLIKLPTFIKFLRR